MFINFIYNVLRFIFRDVGKFLELIVMILLVFSVNFLSVLNFSRFLLILVILMYK